MKATRLLVVDDSELVRRQLERAVLARDPEAALDVAGSFAAAARLDPGRYARALLDLDLGASEGDGATLAERYRARGADAARLAIAFFTSESEGEAFVRASAIGICFRKPDDLARAVAWLVEGDATVEENARRA